MSDSNRGTVRPNGKRIKELRIQNGLHIEELADKIGYSRRTIQHLEAGQPALLRTVQECAAGLGVRYEELLEGYTPSEVPPETDNVDGGGIAMKVTTEMFARFPKGISGEVAKAMLFQKLSQIIDKTDRIVIEILRDDDEA